MRKAKHAKNQEEILVYIYDEINAFALGRNQYKIQLKHDSLGLHTTNQIFQ